MDRCWLKGALGDALHAISCAAGYNIRWLMRAIAAQAAKAALVIFYALLKLALQGLNCALDVLIELQALINPSALAVQPGLGWRTPASSARV